MPTAPTGVWLLLRVRITGEPSRSEALGDIGMSGHSPFLRPPSCWLLFISPFAIN